MKYWSGEGTLSGSGSGGTVRATVNADGVSMARDGMIVFHPARGVRAALDAGGTQALVRFTRDGGLLLTLTDPVALACLRRNGYFRTSPLRLPPGYRTPLIASALGVFFFAAGIDLLTEAAVRAVPEALEAEAGEEAFGTLGMAADAPDSAVAAVLRKCSAAMNGFDRRHAWEVRLYLAEDPAQVEAWTAGDRGVRTVLTEQEWSELKTRQENLGR